MSISGSQVHQIGRTLSPPSQRRKLDICPSRRASILANHQFDRPVKQACKAEGTLSERAWLFVHTHPLLGWGEQSTALRESTEAILLHANQFSACPLNHRIATDNGKYQGSTNPRAKDKMWAQAGSDLRRADYTTKWIA